MTGKSMINQAEFIWNRLDDLANSDPDGYKEFIAKQMEERKIFLSKPDPKMAISTVTTDKSHQVFINICEWQRIPYPENDDAPIKLMAGIQKTVTLKSGVKQHIFPVAINRKILEDCCKNSTDEDLLLNLIIDLIESQFKIKLNRNTKKCKEIFVGEKQEDMRKHFLKNVDKLSEDLFDESKVVNSPKDILKHLETEASGHPPPDMEFVEKNFENLVSGKEQSFPDAKSKPLISVVGDGGNNKLPEPEYNFENSVNASKERIIITTIKLPSVMSVAECDLSINEDEIELTVQDKYYLNLKIPRQFYEEKTKAKFVKKKQALILTFYLL